MCHVFSNQSHDELQYYLSIGVSNDGMNNALGDTESAREIMFCGPQLLLRQVRLVVACVCWGN